MQTIKKIFKFFDKLKFLCPGTVLFVKNGYFVSKPGEVKILAIDIIGGKRVFGVEFDPQFQSKVKYKIGENGNEQTIVFRHVPISEKTIKTWNYKILRKEPVTTDELFGYNLWKEAKGGSF